ncbi:nucleotidyltransferase domain-containing protein [Pedobacter frigidisoli]|uniref:Nucleotidyltransferase domain-containing protein n=1 Tax=Pedobacter frigidisoli TaxID=2530455 RepID=A0A4R0P4Q4_9SPHI|nr:nucleotidyltransferase domain-containing protein [Pedobacter frigidisoli]TCD10759.1 nucleotidyltransferase domain-containing protein [Pedobacter frigidisoli]
MENLIEEHLPEIKSLFKKYDVKEAYLFGSAAKNKLKEDSDIDFLINFSDKSNFENYGNNYFDLLYALQDLLKRDVDLVAEETLSNPYLIESINQSKIKLI